MRKERALSHHLLAYFLLSAYLTTFKFASSAVQLGFMSSRNLEIGDERTSEREQSKELTTKFAFVPSLSCFIRAGAV